MSPRRKNATVRVNRTELGGKTTLQSWIIHSNILRVMLRVDRKNELSHAIETKATIFDNLLTPLPPKSTLE